MRRPVAPPTFLAGALAALLATSSGPAQAWSELGHKLVGELAQRHLDPHTRAEVARLLAGEPEPTLAGVASWADHLRDLDPDRFKATSRWHYVNTPPGQQCGYVPDRDCPDGACVVGAIDAQRAILADQAQPLAARRDALKFIVHFIGDVHQPMHANNHDDLGGNRFQVSLRTPLEPEPYARKHYVNGVMGTNLHATWDYYILGSEGLSLRQYADRLDALPWPPMPADGPESGPAAWAGESCRLVEARDVYPPQHALDDAYLDHFRPLGEQRVRQAAWRLAQVLEADLD